MAYWLVKDEPESWSYQMHAKEGVASWDGVRNYTAARNLRTMKKGDRAFFYHSVTEKRLAGVPDSSAGSAGSARIVTYEPDRVTIDANLTRRGIVVLGDNWFPGWKAKLDGKDVDVERVDYVLRGTVVDRGRHRIEYRYQPASWRIGWIVSLLALLALLAAILWKRPWRTGPTRSTTTWRTATGGSDRAGASSGR